MAQLFYDTFIDTDFTPLEDHTPDVGSVPWVITSGSLYCAFGHAYPATDPAWNKAVVNVGVSDCVVSSNIMVNGLTTIFNGLAVRYIDEDRFWYALLATGETLRLYSWDNPTLTLEAESSGVGPNTGTRTMTVTMIGTSLSLSISGSGNTADCTSSLHQTATRHGLAGLYDTVGAGVGSIPYDTFEITGDAPPSGGNPWYHNAQQRVRTSIDRRFEKRGLLWTPSYALGRAA